MKGRTNCGVGGGIRGIPRFTYVPDDSQAVNPYTVVDDLNGNWRIRFLKSGTLTMLSDVTVDIFVVGGGASGCQCGSSTDSGQPNYCGGGGGGYTNTATGRLLQRNIPYRVVVGAGGKVNTTSYAEAIYCQAGGESSFGTGTDYFVQAAGGDRVEYVGDRGGSGGSGGGGGSGNTKTDERWAGNGGSDGYDGNTSSNSHIGGTGQRTSTQDKTTTREFGENGGDLYAGGGAGAQRYMRSGSSSGVTYSAPAQGGLGGGGNGAMGPSGDASSLDAEPGQANTGGGGGGGAGYRGSKVDSVYQAGVSKAAGDGGSGIVIIRNDRRS